MRYAAGVLLIIAAIFNGCAGSMYTAGGAAGAAAGMAGDKIAAEMAKDTTVSDKDRAAAMAAMNQAKSAGGGLMAFGVFLFVMLGLQIAGAVMLFIKKGKTFVLVIAGLTIVAEIVGIMLTKFGYANVAGLLAGALAILAARAFTAAAAPQAAPPAAAAGV